VPESHIGAGNRSCPSRAGQSAAGSRTPGQTPCRDRRGSLLFCVVVVANSHQDFSASSVVNLQ